MRTSPKPKRRRRWLDPLLNLGVVVALLLAVYLLPPDTSLAEVKESGVLRVCVPADLPPLVTGDAEHPGFEIELLRAVARDLGVSLAFNVNAGIGRDINPRNWRVNRAQCHLIAGGVVDTATTRSYLDTTPPHLETGWALLDVPPLVESLDGVPTGFLGGFSGVDRIEVGRWLRSQGAEVSVLRSRDALVEGLGAGTLEAAVTEALGARIIAAENGWSVRLIAGGLAPYPISFGIWKGDLTLKRSLETALERLRRDDVLAELSTRYALAPIEGVFGTAPDEEE